MLHILSVLQRLRKVADRADDVFVAFHAEWEDGDEAEGEPRVSLDHSGREVALDPLVDFYDSAHW